jgi:hypothetical protein
MAVLLPGARCFREGKGGLGNFGFAFIAALLA